MHAVLEVCVCCVCAPVVGEQRVGYSGSLTAVMAVAVVLCLVDGRSLQCTLMAVSTRTAKCLGVRSRGSAASARSCCATGADATRLARQ